VHAKFGEGFFFLRLTRILRGKAGKYARGIIVEKSKKNCRRIVEIFGECRPWKIKSLIKIEEISSILGSFCTTRLAFTKIDSAASPPPPPPSPLPLLALCSFQPSSLPPFTPLVSWATQSVLQRMPAGATLSFSLSLSLSLFLSLSLQKRLSLKLLVTDSLSRRWKEVL
jgi:hypothetical protein